MFDGEPPRENHAALRRYWLVTTEAPGFSGGIGVYTHQSACMFAAHGVAVTVLQYDPEAYDPVCGFRDGYRLIRFAHRNLDRGPIATANLHGALRIAREADAVVRALIAAEGAPDVVEFQDYGALAYGFLKHRLAHPQAAWPRVVLTAHRPHAHCVATDGDSPHEHRTAFLADAERWCYAAADAVLSPCRFILGPLAELGFPLDRAAVVPNPYDPTALRRAPPSQRLQPEALELARALHTTHEPVLFFGKLQSQKGGPDLVASLAALHGHGEAPRLWMFGRDAFLSGTPTTSYDALERRHERLFATGHVRYFGGYDLADIRALCAAHPVAALPYREDCLPYAFVEAVSCGALPLTSAQGGQGELMPPELRDRLTADATRPDAWAAKARALLALGPLERAALSERLQAFVRAATSPSTVLAQKLAALRSVRATYRDEDYPFVHREALRFGAPDPARRAALAEAVRQRGATRRLRQAGPTLRPCPDLISVVVPYYEMHAYIDDTLASIEAQDHASVEVVIVDDGSASPEARHKLDALLAGPRRFPTRVLSKTNGGLADARNAGAKTSQGEHLYFLDADDVIHPSTLSRSLATLKRFRNIGYVGAALKEFGESEGEWCVFDIDGPYIGFHNLQICAFLVRAEAWLEHGVNDPAMSLGMEDYESHIRMFANGVRGIALPETLFSYRKRPGSMSKAFDPHGVAYLYRRIWRNNPSFLRRFGPELVGLHAENGHGAFAPSAGEPSLRHAELFRRDIASLEEVAERLEACASRERLGRALRARCDGGGAEWDYTTARLLLALDREPAFARSLLRSAVERAPQNGWFRLYAMVAELRDGRIGAADALWTDAFEPFCRSESGALGWIVALEAARGFGHVALALRAWLAARVELEIAAPPLHLGAPDELAGGAFTDLHQALAAWRSSLTQDDRRAEAEALQAVQGAAGEALSPEGVEALVSRWRRVWRDERPVAAAAAPPTFWGRTTAAYVGPFAGRAPASHALEIDDRWRWADLKRGGSAAPPAVVAALGRRLRRRVLQAAE